MGEALYDGCAEIEHCLTIQEAEENDKTSIDFCSRVFAQLTTKCYPQTRGARDKHHRLYNKLVKKFKGNFEKYLEPIRVVLGKLRAQGRTPSDQEKLEGVWDAISTYVRNSTSARAQLWSMFVARNIGRMDEGRLTYSALIDEALQHDRVVVKGMSGDSSDSDVSAESEEDEAARTKLQQAEATYKAMTGGVTARDIALKHHQQQQQLEQQLQQQLLRNQALQAEIHRQQLGAVQASHHQTNVQSGPTLPPINANVNIGAQNVPETKKPFQALVMIDVICHNCHADLRVQKSTAFTCTTCGATSHGVEQCAIRKYKEREAEKAAQSSMTEPDPNKAAAVTPYCNPNYQGNRYNPNYVPPWRRPAGPGEHPKLSTNQEGRWTGPRQCTLCGANDHLACGCLLGSCFKEAVEALKKGETPETVHEILKRGFDQINVSPGEAVKAMACLISNVYSSVLIKTEYPESLSVTAHSHIQQNVGMNPTHLIKPPPVPPTGAPYRLGDWQNQINATPGMVPAALIPTIQPLAQGPVNFMNVGFSTNCKQ